MKIVLLSFFLLLSSTLFAQREDTRYFELRIYYCYPGRLDALIERFQNHTTRIFEKHGMENIGYWLPVKNDQSALYYILAYPNKEARDVSWNNFMADAEWKDVADKSEATGKIVKAVTSVFMTDATIFSLATSGNPATERVFEWRSYTCFPTRLSALITRFKHHTLQLFEKHNMTNIAYFITEEKDTTQPKLVYMLAHASEQAATNSWAAFRSDPAWVAARDASEKEGKIVEKVESVYLKPLSFSKIK